VRRDSLPTGTGCPRSPNALCCSGQTGRVELGFDLFSKDHWIPVLSPVVERPTRRGTACSVAFGVVAISIASVLGVQFTGGNTVFTSALVPSSLVAGALPAYSDAVTFTVTYGDGDVASCALRAVSVLEVSGLTGVLVGPVTTAAAVNTGGGQTGGCVSTWQWSRASADAVVVLTLRQPAWLAQHFTWSISAAAGKDAGGAVDCVR
jgi:hypothetical protein